jgi:apolipoprotein N-acyltransferase
VETRKWLLRSTNTGVTAFIDANGRIVKKTSIYDAETLDHEVPMMTGGPTLYVMIGDLVGYLGLFGIVALLVISRRKEEEPPEAAQAAQSE